MKRFKHSLSHYKLLACDMGKLVPVGLVETLPGDTFQQSTAALIRMSPLVAPVMHPVTVRFHHWFVPNRILWDGWEDFITGGPDGLGASSGYPRNLSPITPGEGSPLDYMGVPLRSMAADQVSYLPLRAYNRIYNEFYRDADLVAEVDEDANVTHQIAWEKDYFTTARPWAQKGPAVSLPLGVRADVYTDEVPGNDVAIYSKNVSQWRKLDAGGTFAALSATSGGATSHIYADLTSATSQDIRAVRQAFALQRYQEARAQYGHRYSEYLRYLGIVCSDARLQRPEYLGGGKQTIAFSEVLRTGDGGTPSSSTPIGELRGHGIAALRSNRYKYFCEEHGYILTLMSIRPRAIYADGLHRSWQRRAKEDYWQKELEFIGQQDVRNGEVYAKGTAVDANTFGYQDRYADYRHMPSGVASEFRSTLDYWHLARKFADTPTLNQSFIDCVPSKRIFAEQTARSCWVMVSHSIQARRMVSKSTIGRVI